MPLQGGSCHPSFNSAPCHGPNSPQLSWVTEVLSNSTLLYSLSLFHTFTTSKTLGVGVFADFELSERYLSSSSRNPKVTVATLKGVRAQEM